MKLYPCWSLKLWQQQDSGEITPSPEMQIERDPPLSQAEYVQEELHRRTVVKKPPVSVGKDFQEKRRIA